MLRQILLFILVVFTSIDHVVAQQPLGVTPNSVSVSNTGTGKFYYANRNEPPRAIEFKEKTVASSYFLTNINHYFNISSEFTFIEAESNTDNLGMRHRLMQQYYKGIPIEGMSYRVHEKNGFVTSANGKAVRNIRLDAQTTIGEEQAFHLALKYLNSKDTVSRQGKKLIVSKGFTFAPESFSIAYQFDIDVSLIEQWRISIDARSGHVLNKVSLVNTCFEEEPPLPYGTGTGLTNYYGTQTIQVETYGNGSSRLVGETEHGGKIGTYDFRNVNVLSLLWFFEWHQVYDFYSSNNTYNDPYLRPAVSVQWAAEQAYEYYYTKHNRNSFDNNGSLIKSYVHVDENFNNAFWTHNLLAFGDGSNNNPLVQLDVVAHELTHGVTQFEAGLQYYYESGALNESFSDIFGKAVEFDQFGDTATWQIAKHYQSGGLRDLSNPNLKNQPDTYAGDLWYAGYDDNGGVHTNSGVQNFWFYLLCKGGSGVNDLDFSYSVNPVGMDVATKIAYRNLTEYLSNNSDYLDSRIGSLLATADLYGGNSTVYQEVDKAWDAVGVIDEPIITDFELYDITATTVKIKGNLLPRADNATYHFEYGTTPALGISTSIFQYTDKVEAKLTGLQSETKYYLRLVATNVNGSTFANTEFTTLSLAPLVKIVQTVDVTETTATLHGQVNPNSLPTSFYFEYGTTPALGLVTSTSPLSDATEFLNVSAPVINLQPRQTYYYRLKATNGFASSATESVSFFTAVKPVISSYTPSTAPIGTEVTIRGQNFNSMAAKNLVSFGATHATVVSSSTSEIKVKVPAGASFGSISVFDTESGLTAESVQEFVPTFTGEFKPGSMQLRVGTTDAIYQTLVQDMDGDNKPDIVARHYLGFSVYMNVNQGGDITEESFFRSTFNSDISPSTLSLVDFDGNGLKDIVGYYQNGYRIYPNLSVPGYIFFGAPVDLPVTATFQYVVFRDFDMDGHIDIGGTTSLSSESAQLNIVRNQNPKGSLSANNFKLYEVKTIPYNVYFLTTSDVNNDGASDLLLSSYGTDFLVILTNTGHPGAFDFDETIVQDLTRGRFAQYGANDLNEDGWKDIISQSPYELGNLALLENKGTSPNITFAMSAVALSDYEQPAVQPGDINGDGKVDLLVGTDRREFLFLKNKGGAGDQLSNLTFEKFGKYGLPLPTGETGMVEPQMTINDLNGDGRPDVINTYLYYYGPHDGYQMEIWQNSNGSDCLDPSLIKVEVAKYSATIVLPANTMLDQFEIEYAPAGSTYWWRANSTTLDNLSPGYPYRLRARAKCYLGFTDYYYIDFTTDCADVNSFTIGSIGVDNVSLTAYDIGSFEMEYSIAGLDQWMIVPQYSTQITNLLPGTTYDLRYRGRWCYTPAEFKHKQFTTLCPKLSTLTISELLYNKAVVSWNSNYAGTAILEYSPDNVTWTIIDETRTMSPLLPGQKYFVRGRMACTDIDSDFIQTSFNTPCPAVSTLYVDSVTPFSVKINWTDESLADSYTLTYILTGGAVTTVQTSSTFFILDGLNPGTRYTVAVAPQCVAAKDFRSTTFSTVCYTPFDLSVNGITHTTAELSWDDNFDGLPYSIDYSISGSNIWKTSETALTNISLSELRPGTKYEVRVHINCSSETAQYASVFFETEFYEETTFAPNPTNGKITIRPSKDLIGSHFSIFDNAGRKLADGELRDYTIDLTYFSAGVHILIIDGEKPIKIFKY
jgi:Zn-dependent metalloprotease